MTTTEEHLEQSNKKDAEEWVRALRVRRRIVHTSEEKKRQALWPTLLLFLSKLCHSNERHTHPRKKEGLSSIMSPPPPLQSIEYHRTNESLQKDVEIVTIVVVVIHEEPNPSTGQQLRGKVLREKKKEMNCPPNVIQWRAVTRDLPIFRTWKRTWSCDESEPGALTQWRPSHCGWTHATSFFRIPNGI